MNSFLKIVAFVKLCATALAEKQEVNRERSLG